MAPLATVGKYRVDRMPAGVVFADACTESRDDVDRRVTVGVAPLVKIKMSEGRFH